jgi:hypothetical protein
MVMITLKLADNPHSSQVTEEITRIINLPAKTVLPIWQVPGGMGGPPNNPNQPNQLPNRPPNLQAPPMR